MIGVAHGILTPVEISVHVTPTTASRRSSVDRLLPKVCFCRFRRDTSVARALWPCGAVEGLGWWCGSGIGGKSPRVELQGAGGPQIHLDMEITYNNNIAHEGRRLLLTSIGIPLANAMGLVSSNIFRNNDAPGYIPALATTAAFGATGIVLTLGLGAFMIFDNQRRDREQGIRKRGPDVSTILMRDGPKAPDFRWYY